MPGGQESRRKAALFVSKVKDLQEESGKLEEN